MLTAPPRDWRATKGAVMQANMTVHAVMVPECGPAAVQQRGIVRL
jgi:hypothetical protein